MNVEMKSMLGEKLVTDKFLADQIYPMPKFSSVNLLCYTVYVVYYITTRIIINSKK